HLRLRRLKVTKAKEPDAPGAAERLDRLNPRPRLKLVTSGSREAPPTSPDLETRYTDTHRTETTGTETPDTERYDPELGPRSTQSSPGASSSSPSSPSSTSN